MLILSAAQQYTSPSAIDRMRNHWPTARMVHTPVHASWLNQCEIYFSVVQRKVVTPNDFYDLADVEDRLLAFQNLYNAAARSFKWKYTTDDLNDLLARITAHEHTRSLALAA